MINYIISFCSIFGIVIWLNIRAWDKTKAESLFDPVNWLGAAVIFGIALVCMYIEKKTNERKKNGPPNRPKN